SLQSSAAILAVVVHDYRSTIDSCFASIMDAIANVQRQITLTFPSTKKYTLFPPSAPTAYSSVDGAPPQNLIAIATTIASDNHTTLSPKNLASATTTLNPLT
ncbi:hypothetical protein Salat_2575400, partial [Sesamum alatum]